MRQSIFYLFLVLFLTLPGACASTAKSTKPVSQAAPTTEKKAAVYRNKVLEAKLFAATARLYASYKREPYGCTATAIMKEKNNYYLFLTAAHCLIVDHEKDKKDWEYMTDLYLRLENPETKEFEYYPAKRVMLDHDKDKAFDFGLVGARIARELPLPDFSRSELKVNDCVVSVAYPKDSGGADIFYGFVEYVNDGVEAFVSMGQIKSLFGASGAAIVSCHNGDILGVIIGYGDKENKDKIYMLLTPRVTEFFQFELKKRGYWPKE